MKTIAIILLSFTTLVSTPKTINPERKVVLDKMFELLEKNVANPNWLKTKTFQKFKSRMYSRKVMKLSDRDFLTYFKEQRHTLDFSHFDLYAQLTDTKHKRKKESPMYWKPLNKKIAYMRVRTFVMDAKPMIKAITEIGIDKFDHLIIDLRDNGGGNLDAPVVLGRFLTQESIDAGIYLTRKWFLEENRSATQEDIKDFPFLKEFTLNEISKMYATEKAFRMVLPPHTNPIFQGKVYVLVNSNTASACEPLIDILQKKKIATIVGPVSAGNMLTGQEFKINEKYTAFIPIADYQTARGNRLDQVGVTPDHKVRSENTANYVLTKLIGVKSKTSN